MPPIESPHRQPGPLSRRRFLTTAAGAIAVPMVLPGCSSSVEESPPTAAAPINTPRPAARPGLPSLEPVVRVRIASIRGSGQGAATTVGEAGQWLRVRSADSRRRGIVLRGPIRVEAGERAWTIVDAGGLRPQIDDLDPVEFSAPDGDGPLIAVGESLYPGRIRVVHTKSSARGAFDIVNHAPLEAYLPGVLARELFSHWHAETFAAQAIAARSYACCEIARVARRRHFDVHNTQASQVYGGATSHRTSLEAVETTRGRVITYAGLMVPGYYSSCCGGAAASAINAISPDPTHDIPPLRDRAGPDACQASPLYRWSITRDRAALTRRIAVWGRSRSDSGLRDLSGLAAIEPIAHNAHGRPTRFAIVDQDDQRFEVEARRMTAMLNHSGSGIRSPREPARSSNLSVRIEGANVMIDGRGFGHGVGLCQYGAEGLAQNGMRHRAIVERFYPEAEVVSAYG